MGFGVMFLLDIALIYKTGHESGLSISLDSQDEAMKLLATRVMDCEVQTICVSKDRQSKNQYGLWLLVKVSKRLMEHSWGSNLKKYMS